MIKTALVRVPIRLQIQIDQGVIVEGSGCEQFDLSELNGIGFIVSGGAVAPDGMNFDQSAGVKEGGVDDEIPQPEGKTKLA